MSTPPSGAPRSRRRKAPEPHPSPFQQPRGIIYSGITIVLLALFVVTLLQAACSPAPGPASPSASAPPPTPAAPASAAASASASASAPAKPTFSSPPPMTIDTSRHYTATIETEKGTIVLDLDPQLAPQTVNNFVFLAKQGFYDGLRWHRVVPGFVIQGGDPQGTGAGGPGYKFPDEPVKAQYTEGCVAMANAGPNTNGSQFFICTADDTHQLQFRPTPSPSGPLLAYNLFGFVKSGLDVAKKIQTTDHMLKVTIS